jgi:hypothetical protein
LNLLFFVIFDLEKEVETINGGLKFQEKTQENEFLVKKKKECGRNLKNTRNLEKKERGR